jgi:hypothetical protein
MYSHDVLRRLQSRFPNVPPTRLLSLLDHVRVTPPTPVTPTPELLQKLQQLQTLRTRREMELTLSQRSLMGS